MKGLGKYVYLGGTLDDAVGETFDKIGKVLGLKFPGGPEVEKKAINGDEKAFLFPKPLVERDNSNLNLSFSGLKSHIKAYILNNIHDLSSETYLEDIAASFQKTISEILNFKLEKAINYCNKLLPIMILLCIFIVHHSRKSLFQFYKILNRFFYWETLRF